MKKLITSVILLIILLMSGCATDLATGSVVNVAFDHHQIHEGDSFLIEDFADLANNNVVDIRFSPPNTTTWSHLLYDINTESEYLITLYEDVGITVAGTVTTSYNRQRNSTNTATLVVDIIQNANLANANADTNLAGSTVLILGITGSGRGEGGEQRGEREVILKQGTIYNLRMNCVAAGWLDYELKWYEHVSKTQEDMMPLLFGLMFIAVVLTAAMFISRQSMLGFACAIFWVITGALALQLSEAEWDILYYIFFASAFGMTAFTSLAAFGLREKRDTQAEGEMDEESTDPDAVYIDEEPKKETDIFSTEPEKKEGKTKSEEIRERAAQRRRNRGL